LYSFRTCIEIIGTMFGSWRLSLIFGGQEFWLKSSGVDLNWTFPVLEQEGWSFLFRNRTELYRFRNENESFSFHGSGSDIDKII
jgi:hypothetical protein